MNNNAELVDGWAQNRAYPDTFQVPDIRDLQKLRPGQFVKVGVRWERDAADGPGPTGERFWVEVTDNTSAPMAGIVRQIDMIYSREHGVNDEDVLFFFIHHILAIQDF